MGSYCNFLQVARKESFGGILDNQWLLTIDKQVGEQSMAALELADQTASNCRHTRTPRPNPDEIPRTPQS